MAGRVTAVGAIQRDIDRFEARAQKLRAELAAIDREIERLQRARAALDNDRVDED